MSSYGPWAARFLEPLSDSDLDDRIRIQAVALTNLADWPALDAANALKDAMSAVFLPTPQVRAIIRQLASAAGTYAKVRFPDEIGFIRALYAPPSYADAALIFCLTGLAGVGKTQILRAFYRCYSQVSEVAIAGHSPYPIIGVWLLGTHAGASLRQMVLPCFRGQGSDKPLPAKLIEVLCNELVIQGISMLGVDELQFLVSSSATDAVAKRVMTLGRLGPPLAFSANYGLVQRLLKRPHEERQRLFAAPILVCPDRLETSEWQEYLSEISTVCHELEAICTEQQSVRIYRYTFGIRRCVISLLRLAYIVMRNEKASRVSGSHLQVAFLSAEYSANRADVETLFQRAFQDSSRRTDLVCPFTDLNHAEPGPEIDLHRTQNERMAAEIALESSLTNEEREKLAPAKRAPRNTGVETKRPPATSEALLKGALKAQDRVNERRSSSVVPFKKQK